MHHKRLSLHQSRPQPTLRQVVAALAETMRLMAEIDAAIPAWPMA